jgi:hypothetical protein
VIALAPSPQSLAYNIRTDMNLCVAHKNFLATYGEDCPIVISILKPKALESAADENICAIIRTTDVCIFIMILFYV